jgi:hypothetical protein
LKYRKQAVKRGRDAAEGQNVAENEDPPQRGSRGQVPGSFGMSGSARAPEPNGEDHGQSMRLEKAPDAGSPLRTAACGPDPNQIPRTSSMKKDTDPNPPSNAALALRIVCLSVGVT